MDNLSLVLGPTCMAVTGMGPYTPPDNI